MTLKRYMGEGDRGISLCAILSFYNPAKQPFNFTQRLGRLRRRMHQSPSSTCSRRWVSRDLSLLSFSLLHHSLSLSPALARFSKPGLTCRKCAYSLPLLGSLVFFTFCFFINLLAYALAQLQTLSFSISVFVLCRAVLLLDGLKMISATTTDSSAAALHHLVRQICGLLADLRESMSIRIIVKLLLFSWGASGMGFPMNSEKTIQEQKILIENW